MKVVRLWLPLCCAGMLVGCGQKGPLVLPDAPKHKKVRAPAAPAPAKPPATAPPATGPATGAASSPSDKTPNP
jgi:predicted small lipoprotein YifL